MARSRKRGFSLLELMIILGVIGILATIALPNFIEYQARARMSEAKANLRGWYTAESSIFQEKGGYSELLSETGFTPIRGNRYQYMFSKTCTYEVRATATATSTDSDNCITVDQLTFPGMALTPAPNLQPFTYSGVSADPGNPAGLGGTCPLCSIRAVAAGNVDFDPAVDTWVMSTKDGVMNSAGCGVFETAAPAGIPFQTFNDAVCN
jgi:type IV pilus assembly protein PilA